MKGLFKNKMLVQVRSDCFLMGRYLIALQAFRHIFTSPSSADCEDVADDTDEEDQTPTEPPLKRQRGSSEKRSRAHVAALIGMKAVSPRAIAYTAVQVSIIRNIRVRFLLIMSKLRFALSSCNSWRIIDEDFDYAKFYNNITTFFEDVHTTQDKKAISKLLLWWNRYATSIFHFQVANSSHLTAPFLTVLTRLNIVLRKSRRSQ